MLQSVANAVAVAFRWCLILFLVGWALSILSVAPVRADSLMLTALTTSLGLAGVSAFLAGSASGSEGAAGADRATWREAAREFFTASILLAQGIAVVLIGDVLAAWLASQVSSSGSAWSLAGLMLRLTSLVALGATSVAAWRWSEAGHLLREPLRRRASDRPLERRDPSVD